MKYIITEQQEIRLAILRRIDEDWPWILEIIDEGVDIDDPCDFTLQEYVDRICTDSARTYLFNWFTTGEKSKDKEFSRLLKYYSDLIQDRVGKDIMDYWLEKQDDCL